MTCIYSSGFKHLEWRAKEKIDTIDKEDWEDIIKEYPVFFDNVDKQGRSVAEYWMSDWNVRQALLTGKLSKLTRLLTYCMESQTRLLYEARAQGSNVTQGTILVDLEGVNIIQQVCPNCLPVYLTMTTNLETHYPYIWNRLYYVNTPAPFEIIIRVIRPIMRKSTRDAMKTYVNKKQWLPLRAVPSLLSAGRLFQILGRCVDKN
ncbi:unnamed protein product [Orchesella dallaii]|uniref:CRAL-TRIO domain-containing protein n=1 Tax=Orchesella dallaii TaxID=48710 RepID=A0ABP1PLE7_9HEXA